MNNSIKNLQKLLHIVRKFQDTQMRAYLRGQILYEIYSVRKQIQK
jgi:hypothetical protein